MSNARTIIVERDSRDLTTRVVAALNSQTAVAENAVRAETAATSASASAAEATTSAGQASASAAEALALAQFVEASLASLRAQQRAFDAGSFILTRAEGFRYEVMPAGTALGGAAGYHLTTAGGVLLRAVPGTDGYDIRAFGAVGDGVADDTVPMRLMFETTETRLNLKGRFRISQPLTRAISTAMHGHGLQSSIIILANNARLTFQGGDGGDHYNMRFFRFDGISFRSAGVNTGHILRVEYIGGTGGTSKSISLRDCEVVGTDNTGGFALGIDLHNCRNVWIDSTRIHGARNGAISGTGLRIHGDNPSGAPVEFFLEGVQCYYLNKGFDVTGWVEGIYMSKCTGIAVHYGMTASVTPAARPLLYVRDCHFNTDQFGILSVGFVQFQMSGNSFYGQYADDTQTASWVGIQIDPSGAALNSRINDNDFQRISAFTQNIGIVIANDPSVENLVIGGNSFNSLQVGALLNADSNGIVVRDDNTFNSVEEPVRDLGAANRVEVGTYASGAYAKGFGDGLQVKGGVAVVTLNASGDGTIPISPAFRTEVFSATISNGDSATLGDRAFSTAAVLPPSGINFSVRPNPGAVSVRVNWIAFGR